MKEQIILISIFCLLVFSYSKEKEKYIIGESKFIDENAIAYTIYNKSYERTG